MTSEILIFSVIHLLVPLAGVFLYYRLCCRMMNEGIPHPPFMQYFALFTIFGGWLVAFLTGLFWHWSGMASLGMFFLLFFAPFLTGAVAFSLRNRVALSAHHRRALILGLGYSGVALIAWVILIMRMLALS